MTEKKKVFRQQDHIILPKSTLKRFTNPVTKKIKYLDLSNPENISIEEIFPKSFHTKPNYYISEYDNIIKEYETMLGNYFKSITDAHENNLDIQVDAQQLKEDVLDIVNIQFQRSIIADNENLEKLKEQLKEQYNKESLFYLSQGIYPEGFLKRKDEFNQSSKDSDTFRYYVQKNIFKLREKNQKIIDTYKNFVPHILIIPDNINSTFILSPQHFVPNEQTVRIILSPRIALSLYPYITQNHPLIKYLTKEEVDSLVFRTIDSALAITDSFRQIVGEENYLNCIKNKLQKYKSILYNFEDDIISVKDCIVELNDNQAFFELAVSIRFFKPNCNKIIIKLSAISNQFLQEHKLREIIHMFEKQKLELVFVDNNDLKKS